MENKKGSVGIIAIIIIIVAITAGALGWMFAKKSQSPSGQISTQLPESKTSGNENSQANQQKDKIGINDFSVAVEKNNQLAWSSSVDVKSGETVHFRLAASDVDFCNISGGNLFDPKSNLTANETDIKKQADDFSGGIYTLNCIRKSDNKTVSKNITFNVTPANKLVMCTKKCGSGGTPVVQDMTRFLGETVQKIRACFGSYLSTCPSQDVTDKTSWTSTNPDVADWTRDLEFPEKTYDKVYPKKTFITEKTGTSIMKAEYKGYSYSVNVTGKIVGQ